MAQFSVSFEIVTEESAAEGEAEERGFEVQGVSLREAVGAVLGTRTSLVGGVESIEPSTSEIEAARWFTVTNGREFATGAQESRSLHVPAGVTGASRRRIARLVGVAC